MEDCVRYISNITKEYPDMYKIILYKEPALFIHKDTAKRNKELVLTGDYEPTISSLNRTKTLIRDIVLCNDFELFCTFTFNPKKVDSFNLFKCWGVMSTWISHQRIKSEESGKQLKYLIVPEQHKSGRWHFHALISGYTSTLKPSGIVTTSCRPVYNITSFRSGFTTAVPIDSKEGVSLYVTKYITKDFVKEFNHRRFFCSRNLLRPKRELNSSILRSTCPIFHRKVSESQNQFEFIIDKRDLYDTIDLSSHKVVQYTDSDFKH